jgi:hypothetical protein
MKLCLIIFSTVVLHLSLAAQTAYSSLDIGIQGSVNINKNRFHEFWQSEPVTDIYAVTPFYAGFLKIGISINEYSGTPEYEAYFPYLAWGFQVPDSSLLAWINSIKVGNYLMQFGDYETNETKTDESELGLMVSTGLSFILYKRIRINVSLDYFRVYTRYPIELTYLSAGLSYGFNTPQWFRNFLK